MSVLVTGGCGYIGSNTVVELIQSGYEVIILDNFYNSSREIIDEIEKITNKTITFYNVDLKDKNELNRVFIENEINSVVHLAGLKSISESLENPLIYYNNNVEATLNLLSTMDEHNVNNLIFSSSATVYGTPDTLPIKESSQKQALNPYGRTKLIVEEILEDLAQSNGIWRIVSLRYFNPVGAHASGLLAERPEGTPSNLVPYISRVATNELKELKVFGGDYETKDGTGIRDFIHIEDLAKGHVAALDNITKIEGFEPFNLGTGEGYSVLDVIENFENASGLSIPYTIVERRDGDVPISYSDTSKSKKILGWKAKKGIKEMCSDTWRAVKVNRDKVEA